MALLVDTFLQKMQETVTKLLKQRDDALLRGGIQAVVGATKLGEKVIFTEGTMRMLTEKLAHYDQTAREIVAAIGGQQQIAQIVERAQSFRGGWLQFPRPIEQAAALLCFRPAAYIPTGKDNLQMYLIGANAEIVDALEEVGQNWRYQELLHTCPLCTKEYGVLVPCQRCQEMLNAWGKIFSLSAIIAGQYLAALRYEEQTLTTMRRVPRTKGGKERRVPVKHTFKVIDANEIIIQVQAEAPLPPVEPRGTWIDSNTVYEEIRTRPFTRTYRSERYVNVRGQTHAFPEGIVRLQPRKVENLGKVVTKVKASLYEEKDK